MLDLDRLNDHSRVFAHRLFREFPDWLQYARYDPYEDFEKEALLVEVPRPTDGSGNGLFITTSEWEIAVGFGESFHTRFGVSGDAEAGNFLDDAMDFIHDFVNERIAVATARQGNEWLGAWKVDPRARDLDALEKEEGVVVTVHSWRGTYDREIR
jgi:hypothetical protein